MAIGNFNSVFPGSGNQGYTTDPVQTYLHRVAIDNFEESLSFYKMGKKPDIVGGYYTTQWARFEKIGADSIGEIQTNFLNNPSDTDVKLGTIGVKPRLWGIVGTVSTFVDHYQALSLVGGAMKEFSNAMGRKIDELIQTQLLTTATNSTNVTTNTTYPGAITTNVALATANASDTQFTTANIIANVAKLRKRAVPGMMEAGGNYALIIHPDVEGDLLKDAKNNSIIDVFKHTPDHAGKILKGYIGSFLGTDIFCSNNLQTVAQDVSGTNVPLYPCYFIGGGTYGVLNYGLTTHLVRGNDKSDTLDLGTKFGLKLMFNTIVLQPAGLQVHMCRSTLA